MRRPNAVRITIPAAAALFAAALLMPASAAHAQVVVEADGAAFETRSGAAPSYALERAPVPASNTEESFVDGLWWSFGVGGGSARLTCDICTADRDPGMTFQVALGARAREDLDVGIEAGGWTRDDGGVRETARRVDLRGILRPWQNSGFHVIGGLGWVGYEAGDLTYDAAALSAGVGWDFPFSGRWRIGNRLLLDAASWGSFRNDGDVAADDVSLSIARLEVVLTRR